MTLSEFVNTYPPEEKHKIKFKSISDGNYIIPSDGRTYYLQDDSVIFLLYDITAFKSILQSVDITLEDIYLCNMDGLAYASNSSSICINMNYLRDLVKKYLNIDLTLDNLEEYKKDIQDFFKNVCKLPVRKISYYIYEIFITLDEDETMEKYSVVKDVEYEMYYKSELGWIFYLNGNYWCYNDSIYFEFDVIE